MADPNHPRKFTEEFRRQIVQLYLAGKPRGELMAEYDLGSSTLSRWIKCRGEAGVTTEAAARTPEDERLLELERENKRLRMEVDILKQAALIFARKQPPSPRWGSRRRASTCSARIAAASSRTPASTTCWRRSMSGGPSPARATRATTRSSSPPTGS